MQYIMHPRRIEDPLQDEDRMSSFVYYYDYAGKLSLHDKVPWHSEIKLWLPYLSPEKDSSSVFQRKSVV